jgi:hypothetical protein
VKPALGWYVALPDTVAVPTVVPPLVHVLGAVVCGPNTVNVTVPVAPLVAPESTELIEVVAIAVPEVSVAGAAAVVIVRFLTTVEVIPDPQVLAELVLFESPLYDTYHQYVPAVDGV